MAKNSKTANITWCFLNKINQQTVNSGRPGTVTQNTDTKLDSENGLWLIRYKPLPEPLLINLSIGLLTIDQSMKFQTKRNNLHSIKCIRTFLIQNCDHFRPATMCQILHLSRGHIVDSYLPPYLIDMPRRPIKVGAHRNQGTLNWWETGISSRRHDNVNIPALLALWEGIHRIPLIKGQ